MRIFFKILLLFLPFLVYSQNEKMIRGLDGNQKKMLLNLLRKDATVSIFSRQHQYYLDSILTILPEDPFFWQQKAMPLFKQKKYELGMTYLNKAVDLDDSNHYREYRAFIKCIFQKSYLESLAEFNYLAEINGSNGVIMDHIYDFWKGLCYLQLNDFATSKTFIEKSVAFGLKNDIVNPYEMFYLGVIEFETGNYFKAIENLDKSLKLYPNFSDAKYFKALSLMNLNETAKAEILLLEAQNDLQNGFTFNEGNSLYEQFPYQVTGFMYANVVKLFEVKK
ncbi:Tetratricopeptide repeat-containing protein [Kaistella jeonii]|nr:Tetratricopeptide repeat-containing protein [Kaistella jeonii]VEI96902.1 putative PEP-CTERM system TPR-repeat lipoprotein [Kaistella jeonii]